MQKADHNPRRDFLKLIPLAIVSIGAFSFLKTRKSNQYPEKEYNTLSKSEADNIIKNEKFQVSTRIIPAPAPVAKKNIEG